MKNELKDVMVAVAKGKCQDSLKESLPSHMARKHPQIEINVNEM